MKNEPCVKLGLPGLFINEKKDKLAKYCLSGVFPIFISKSSISDIICNF